MRMDTMQDCNQDQRQTSKRNYKYTSTTDQAVIKQTAHLTRAKTTSTRHGAPSRNQNQNVQIQLRLMNPDSTRLTQCDS